MTLSFGKQLPSDTPVWKLRSVMQEMECEAWFKRRETASPIHHQFFSNVRKKPSRLVIADKDQKLKGWQAVTGAVSLARLLNPMLKDQKNIGIVLPTGVASILVNLATTLSGRVAVNLNFTVGKEASQSAISQSGLKTLITSRLFVEKIQFELSDGVNILYIEDLLMQISFSKKLRALIISLFTPVSMVEKYCGSKTKISVDDILTIIFTSGSTGEPKGVVLSHFNLLSNVESVFQVIPYLGKKKNLLASLPLFHSFGYMMMWLGLSHKMGLITHSNPLEFKMIGELVKKFDVKLMMSTPTFLRGYILQVNAAQFGSLQCIITGAEKLPNKLAESFALHFGIRPIEGYGATECSPVIATSTQDVRQPGIYQVGNVKGTVGQTVPGVIAKIVNPETFEELPQGSQGLLLVRGPNVMVGYLNAQELTDKVMHNGWYNTGDIAVIDESGFITITDRMRRISKIGGEMVPHGRVEEALHEAADIEDLVFAVTAIPDDKKGEKLVVLHTYEETKLGEILKNLKEKGLSNLYIPSLENFIKLDQLPMLGSGKLDLQGMKQLALKL